jgi:haloalkane dehalogenase
MSNTTSPFAKKKFIEIKGRRMAYIDEGEGAPIVFQHGNPTSSYLWRNVMPACKGLGRLIACDLIGMGDSDKLENSGPDRYTYVEQRSFLFALWEELKLDRDVVLVLHDWGSALGFDWANQNRSRVQGIAYMEALVTTLDWGVFRDSARPLFEALRSSAGEDMVLRDNMFVEEFIPGAILRPLADAEMNEYRRPFLNAGEDRRPTLSWPRQIPIDGSPADVTEIVTAYSQWLSQSQTPKLYIHADPGAMDVENGKFRAFCKKWPNQKEVTVKGIHYLQEDSGPEIGAAVAEFVRGLRKTI